MSKNYFKGYYFKHTVGNEVFSFIVSYHISRCGQSYSSIQFINSSGSYVKRFPLKAYRESKEGFGICVGSNIFSSKGIKVDIQFDEFHLKCQIKYTPFTPLQSHIMGPFKWIPFMECNHDVYSLTHQLKGQLVINDVILRVEGGTGYIEGDKGHSFPEQYLWTQANFTTEGFQNSVMTAVATIPMICFSFMGVIAEIYFEGVHYRFATYKFVKIIHLSKSEVHLKQGNLYLKIKQLTNNSFSLDAPTKGLMRHKIKESPACDVLYEFYQDQQLLFSKVIHSSSFESKNLS